MRKIPGSRKTAEATTSTRLVTCLGPNCRGEKTFRSRDPKKNRICPRCADRIASIRDNYELA